MGFSSSSSFPFDTFSSLNPSRSPLSFEVRDSNANTVGAETLAAAEATPLTQLPISVTENYGLPQPLERLQGDPIPPFLSKTFALVDDPSLDPIISWASAGESFVIWEPMEFARLVLPRNFKHNNFSSFVRQLNTYFYAYAYEARTAIILQGFRKTDTDKWEFSNGCFVRGKKHLLKNIHRRRSTTQSRQLSICGRGSTSVESAKSSLGTVMENLKKEKCVLMQEVEGLQQENRGTACRVEVVKQRLQEAEQRHKQMISFIANVFQNPVFVERLCQMKAHRELSLPRTRRKLLERKQGEGGGSSGSAEGQIVKFEPESSNRTASEIRKPELSSSKYLSQDVVGNFSAEMDSPLRELAAVQELRDVPEQLGDGASILEPGEHFLKGNGILSPQMEVASPDYYMALPEDLAMGKGFLECPSPGTENLVFREEELLSMDFDGTAAVAASETEFWDNITNGDFPEIGPSCSDGLSDIWGLGSLPAAGDILE